MQKIVKIIICFAAPLLLLGSCEESKRYEISGGDGTPPGMPIFLESEPLPGGARIFFQPPADKDVLYIEASYTNINGKMMRFAASFSAGSVDVLGFDREGEHTVDICAVDRSGNRSASFSETVRAFEPIATTVAKTVEVLPSFSSMLVKWKNEDEEPLYVWVDIAYTQDGVPHRYSAAFNTYQTETRSIDSLKLTNGELVSVWVSVGDKYGNVVAAKETEIVLLVDEVLPKDNWSIPVQGTMMGGIVQADGLRLYSIIDGLYDINGENFFFALQSNPWNVIIDLGEEYEISRVVTHQRWTGYDVPSALQGNLYRGDNVMTANVYRWDGMYWYLLSQRRISTPAVKSNAEYTLRGKAGDMTYVFPDEPQFSRATRYFRFEAVNGKYLSEITLYGRKAR